MHTDLSFEALGSAYHALKSFDSFLWILAGILGIFCNIDGGCLYGPKVALNILLGGTKYFAVVFIRNLMGGGLR